MLQGLPYGREVDWWALGVMMYVMMAGCFPFGNNDECTLQPEIKYHELEYPTGISIEAELIMRRVRIISIKSEALHVLD